MQQGPWRGDGAVSAWPGLWLITQCRSSELCLSSVHLNTLGWGLVEL
jgi:hypothetical protein